MAHFLAFIFGGIAWPRRGCAGRHIGLSLVLLHLMLANKNIDRWRLEIPEDLEQQLVRNHRHRRIIDHRSNHRHRRHRALHP